MACKMPTLGSNDSTKVYCVRFVNSTSRKVHLIWFCSITGSRTYKILQPNHQFDMDAVEGQEWLALELKTRTDLQLNGEDVFCTSMLFQRPIERCSLRAKEAEGVELRRELIYITVSKAFSLVDKSATVVAKNIHSVNDVAALDIPVSLKGVVKSHFMKIMYQ